MGRMARTAGITSSYTPPTHYGRRPSLLISMRFSSAYSGERRSAVGRNLTISISLRGARLTTVKQMIPDIAGAVQNVLYSLFYRMSRSVSVDYNGNVIPAAEQQTPPQQVRSNGYVDFPALRAAISG